MRKFVAILTMTLVCSVCSTTVNAAVPMNGRNCVDADGDGICDNYGNGYGCGNGYGNGYGCGNGYGNGYGNSYGNGNGNGCSNGYGCGRGYVDADGDGVCDNMKYAIKYNLRGGRNNKKNPSYYYSTSKTVKLKKPTRKGYTFKGWYADKKYKKKVTAIKKGSFGKKTLYAKWKKK